MNFFLKKYLGQHFLTDNNIAKKIIKSLSFKSYKIVVELGPGKGILSYYLSKICKDFFLIEIDSYLVDLLINYYPSFKDKVFVFDFLKWHPKYFGINCFALVGNFPYNISSQILFKIIFLREFIPECIGMFQRDFAYRIVSKKSNKSYGIISVLVQAFYKVDYLFSVSENVFYPKPKVKSAVIKLTRKKNPPNCNIILFFKIVKTSFNQRRKILKNSLKSLNFSKKFYFNDVLLKRPEDLSINDFINLTNIALKFNSSKYI